MTQNGLKRTDGPQSKVIIGLNDFICCITSRIVLLARLYESTGRAIAVTQASTSASALALALALALASASALC